MPETWPSKQQKKAFRKCQKNQQENRKKQTTFFNPETETDPDQKPTFEQKTDPDRLTKVNPAGLYL
jgi:hypothetical protein